MFNYTHGEKMVVNTELGEITLTYIDTAKLEENVFLGEKEIAPGMENHPTYWEAVLGDGKIIRYGVIAKQAIAEIYQAEALQRFYNLKLDLPV